MTYSASDTVVLLLNTDEQQHQYRWSSGAVNNRDRSRASAYFRLAQKCTHLQVILMFIPCERAEGGFSFSDTLYTNVFQAKISCQLS